MVFPFPPPPPANLPISLLFIFVIFFGLLLAGLYEFGLNNLDQDQEENDPNKQPQWGNEYPPTSPEWENRAGDPLLINDPRFGRAIP